MAISRFQYKLRSLLLAVTAVAVLSCYLSHRLYCVEQATYHQRQEGICLKQSSRLTSAADRAYAEKVLQAVKSNNALIEGMSEARRMERLKIESAIKRGHLVISRPYSLPNESLEPNIPPPTSEQLALEADAKRFILKAEYHAEMRDFYLKAIYQPWLRWDKRPESAQ